MTTFGIIISAIFIAGLFWYFTRKEEVIEKADDNAEPKVQETVAPVLHIATSDPEPAKIEKPVEGKKPAKTKKEAANKTAKKPAAKKAAGTTKTTKKPNLKTAK